MNKKIVYIFLSLMITSPLSVYAKLSITASAQDYKKLYETILQLDALLRHDNASYKAMIESITQVDKETLQSNIPTTLDVALDELLHNEKNTGYLDILYKSIIGYTSKTGLSRDDAFTIYESLKKHKLASQIMDPITLSWYADSTQRRADQAINPISFENETAISGSKTLSWQKRFAIIILRFFAKKLASPQSQRPPVTPRTVLPSASGASSRLPGVPPSLPGASSRVPVPAALDDE